MVAGAWCLRRRPDVVSMPGAVWQARALLVMQLCVCSRARFQALVISTALAVCVSTHRYEALRTVIEFRDRLQQILG